jgi:hypothetical protein
MAFLAGPQLQPLEPKGVPPAAQIRRFFRGFSPSADVRADAREEVTHVRERLFCFDILLSPNSRW